MKKFKILEHTADLEIKAFGRNKKELFLNAMIGMFEGAKYEMEEKSREVEREIKIESSDLSSLLVDFLSETISLCEVNWEIYKDVQFENFSDKSLEAVLIGKRLKRMGVQIKGVTYHDLEVEQRKDGTWEATILFDI